MLLNNFLLYHTAYSAQYYEITGLD